MSTPTTISAERRERAGKGAARATRRAGRIPAVIYGNHQDSLMISLAPGDLSKLIQSGTFFTSVYAIKVDGKTERVLPRDLQLHPVTDRPLHVDFMRFSKNTLVTVAVPVEFVNEEDSPGIKQGGVLNVVRHEVELICPPDSIPQELTADLAGLEIGDGVHISSITLPEGVTPEISDRDFTIATIAPPMAEEVEVEDEGDVMDVPTVAESKAATDEDEDD